jgi:hypothetical protein
LVEGFGIRIRSKDNPEGPISANHFMPLVQKLTTKIHNKLLTIIYQLGSNYNFTADPKGIKSKRVRKHTLKVLLEKDGDLDYLWNTSMGNVEWIVTVAIPDVIKEIDGDRGKITAKIYQSSEGRPKVDIKDNTVNDSKTKPKLDKWTKDEILARMPRK